MTKPPPGKELAPMRTGAPDMTKGFNRKLEEGLRTADDIAKQPRPDNEAGRIVNAFRSELAEEIKSCAESFKDLGPDHYHKYVWFEMRQLLKQQTDAQAPHKDLLATLMGMRMTSDSIAAYDATIQRTNALMRRKESDFMAAMAKVQREEELEALGLEEGEDDDGPLYPDD